MIILDGARAELMRLVPRKVGRSWSVRPGEDCRLEVSSLLKITHHNDNSNTFNSHCMYINVVSSSKILNSTIYTCLNHLGFSSGYFR